MPFSRILNYSNYWSIAYKHLNKRQIPYKLHSSCAVNRSIMKPPHFCIKTVPSKTCKLSFGLVVIWQDRTKWMPLCNLSTLYFRLIVHIYFDTSFSNIPIKANYATLISESLCTLFWYLIDKIRNMCHHRVIDSYDKFNTNAFWTWLVNRKIKKQARFRQGLIGHRYIW